MSLTSLRHGNRGGPQIENIKEGNAPRPAVTPRTVESYVRTYGDYVEKPRVGSSWDQLARALGSLNPALDRMAAVHEQRFYEDQTALGQKLMQENQLAWKEFTEKNPDYAGLNPHLERGYKAAYLSSRANDFRAALDEHYTTSGLMAETDPAKVRQAVTQWGKEWTQTNIPSGDYDPQTYAESFLKPAQAAEGHILSRHTNDRANEHLRLAVEQHAQTFTSYVDGVFDSTPNITKPEVFAKAMDGIAARTQEHMAQMEASGLPRSKSTAVIEDAIINLAKAEGFDGHGKEILSLADKIQTGSGTVGGRPEFRAKAKALTDHWDRERKQKADDAFRAYERNRTYQMHTAQDRINRYIYDKDKAGERVSEAELMELAGPNHSLIAQSAFTSYQGHRQNPVNWTTEKQLDYDVDKQLILEGRVSPEKALELYGRYGQKAAALVDLARNVRDGNDPVTKAQASSATVKAKQALDAQIGVIFNDPFMPGGGDKEATKLFKQEARTRLDNEVQVFIEGRLNKQQPPPSQAELDIFVQDKAQEIGRNYQVVMKNMAVSGPGDDPQLMEKPGAPDGVGSEAYWKTNTVKMFGETDEDIRAMDAALKSGNKEAVIRSLQNKYGYSREQVLWMLANQIAVYGLNKPAPEQPKPPAREEYDPSVYLD